MFVTKRFFILKNEFVKKCNLFKTIFARKSAEKTQSQKLFMSIDGVLLIIFYNIAVFSCCWDVTGRNLFDHFAVVGDTHLNYATKCCPLTTSIRTDPWVWVWLTALWYDSVNKSIKCLVDAMMFAVCPIPTLLQSDQLFHSIGNCFP